MSAGIEIRAPTEQTEGTRSQILRWLKQVGERVEEDEPLIEIETDKVTVEVASPGAGVLREILRREQEEIAPGELLGVLDPASRTATEAAAPAPSRAAGAARPAGEAPSTTHAAPGAGSGARAAAAEAAAPLSPAVRRLLAGAVHGSGAQPVLGEQPPYRRTQRCGRVSRGRSCTGASACCRSLARGRRCAATA